MIVPNNSNKADLLMIDDILENIVIVENSIDPAQICFHSAHNGRLGITMAEEILPDLILLDVSMPGMSGFEVCMELKKGENTRGIPIIFLTAQTEHEHIVKGFEIGAVDYITKPFNANELLSRINTHLELKFATEQLEHTNNILEETVRNRTFSLDQANKALEFSNQKLKHLDDAKRDFLNIINHELRTPLHGIQGFTEMLKSTNLSEQQLQFVGFIDQSVNRLNRLTRLAYIITSLKADHPISSSGSVHLLDIIRAILFSKNELIQSRNLEICMTINEDDLIFSIDKELVNSCLDLLIENAVMYSKENSIINIANRKDEEFRILTIKNTGAHHSPIDMNDLTDLFSNKETEYKSGRLGLGLATSKLIMEELSGKINFSCTGNNEVVVEIYFPLK